MLFVYHCQRPTCPGTYVIRWSAEPTPVQLATGIVRRCPCFIEPIDLTRTVPPGPPFTTVHDVVDWQPL